MPVKKIRKPRVGAPVPKRFKPVARKLPLAEGLEMTGFYSYVSVLEAIGLSKVWSAYAKFTAGDDIMAIGFNSSSGYVYIALENGVTIASMLGRSVDYIVTDYNTGEEYFYKTYKTAENKLKSINK